MNRIVSEVNTRTLCPNNKLFNTLKVEINKAFINDVYAGADFKNDLVMLVYQFYTRFASDFEANEKDEPARIKKRVNKRANDIYKWCLDEPAMMDFIFQTIQGKNSINSNEVKLNLEQYRSKKEPNKITLNYVISNKPILKNEHYQWIYHYTIRMCSNYSLPMNTKLDGPLSKIIKRFLIFCDTKQKSDQRTSEETFKHVKAAVSTLHK